VVMSPSSPHGEIIATIAAPPVYTHSSFLTENYYIFAYQPYRMAYNGIPVLFYNNLLEALHWDETSQSVFYVIDRKKKRLVAEYKTVPFFFFHSINAYEATEDINGEQVKNIVCDVIGYDDPEIVKQLNIQNMASANPIIPIDSVRRYVLPDIGRVSKEYANSKTVREIACSYIVDNLRAELPRINSAYNMRDYRYVYVIASQEGKLQNELLKIDVKMQKVVSWSTTSECHVGEPVFVAHPEALNEDDGIILSVVFCEDVAKSFLVCLDATSFKEIARAELPKVVPAGFHGTFVN